MRIFLFALLLSWALPSLAQNAIVAEGTHVNLRAGKTDNYRVIRVLAPLTPVEIIETSNEMAKVKTKEGDTGWLPARLLVLEPMDTPMPKPQEATPPAADQPALSSPAETKMEEPVHDFNIDWMLLLVGALCFVVGAAVGIGAHEAYYRKRLNGLRI